MSDTRIDALEQQLARTADELAGLQRLVEALVNRVDAAERANSATLTELTRFAARTDGAIERHDVKPPAR